MSSVEEIEARANAATPGPWTWWGNVDSKQIHLRSTARSDRNKWENYAEVMRFARYGMRGAKPVFNDPDHRGYMLPLTEEAVVFQVCPEATRRNDDRVYRGDIVGIRHPDAEFIAHSREDVEFLLNRIRELERTVECLHDERAGLLAAVPS